MRPPRRTLFTSETDVEAPNSICCLFRLETEGHAFRLLGLYGAEPSINNNIQRWTQKIRLSDSKRRSLLCSAEQKSWFPSLGGKMNEYVCFIRPTFDWNSKDDIQLKNESEYPSRILFTSMGLRRNHLQTYHLLLQVSMDSEDGNVITWCQN